LGSNRYFTCIPQVIYDDRDKRSEELQLRELPELELNAYDFLNVCGTHQEAVIPWEHQYLGLSLVSLRRHLILHVKEARDELTKAATAVSQPERPRPDTRILHDGKPPKKKQKLIPGPV
jgi:hypothetical protein